jgi:hypothetical protein
MLGDTIRFYTMTKEFNPISKSFCDVSINTLEYIGKTLEQEAREKGNGFRANFIARTLRRAISGLDDWDLKVEDLASSSDEALEDIFGVSLGDSQIWYINKALELALLEHNK